MSDNPQAPVTPQTVPQIDPNVPSFPPLRIFRSPDHDDADVRHVNPDPPPPPEPEAE
ncbi:MAG: hypothetical protein ABSF61_06545 [Anaerolineales bacterium]|jgi:hypothetical protein